MGRDWKAVYQMVEGEDEAETESDQPATQYTETALEHFQNPRNVGVIEDHHGKGVFGDPGCGDYLEMTLRLTDEDIIEDVRFKVFGCAGAVATSSMVTELAKGRSIREAVLLTDNDVIQALGGLPQAKRHCSLLGIEALRMALADALVARKMIAAGTVNDFAAYREKREAGQVRYEDFFGEEER